MNHAPNHKTDLGKPHEPKGMHPPQSGDEATVARDRVSGYGAPVDAVVLSGTHQNPRRLIQGRNKAFLEIDGKPLVRHVVEALNGARQVGRVYVVGPQAELEAVLQGCPDTICVPQEGNLVSNGWAGVRAMEQDHPQLTAAALMERQVLVISSDLPLISPAAVDDFVSRAAAIDAQGAESNAFIVGVAEEASLKAFYGTTSQPGINRPLVQMNEGLMRLSNIYISRPRKLEHTDILQTSFSYRKAEDWRNVAALAISLFSQAGGWFAAWMTFRLQLTAMLRRGQGRLYRRLRRGNTVPKIERGVSTVLGGPVRVVVSPFGGLSLDVDDDEDFEILTANHHQWKKLDGEQGALLGPSDQKQGKSRPECNDQDGDHQPGEEG